MKHVMADLETLGTGSNAVIISIGAVEFDPETQTLGRTFYEVVDPQSCVDVGMEMDCSTVMWWMKQSDEARKAFERNGTTISSVLFNFGDWYPKDACLWGNGATFDNVIVKNAYSACRLKSPVPYWADRCYRTMKNIYKDVAADSTTGTAHNALDDAVYQAIHLMKICREKNLTLS